MHRCHFNLARISFCRSLFTLLTVFLVANPAVAGSKTAQERAARKACLNGDYAQGISILSDLFVSTQNTTYIFNQGRCLEQNKRYEDAVERFKEYLRAGGEKLSQDDRDAAQKHIADCKATLAEERGVLGATAPTTPQAFVSPKSEPPPTQQPPPAEEVPSSVAAEPARKTTPERTGAGLRIGGIVVASVGVAGVAAGVLLNLKANSIINQMQTTAGDYTHAKDRSHQTYETSAWVAYGAGAACIVTGAILYAVGIASRASKSEDIALVPTFASGQAGALLTGAF